jgi:hypothetical protein
MIVNSFDDVSETGAGKHFSKEERRCDCQLVDVLIMCADGSCQRLRQKAIMWYY